MNPSAKAFRFDDSTLWIDLQDGRTVGVPLAWFPRLLNATPEQRAAGRIGPTGRGLHWEELDEDISVAGVLAGRGDVTGQPSVAAYPPRKLARTVLRNAAMPSFKRMA